MSMTLLEALNALDPANHDHWTNGGDPRMDVIHELTGDVTITRAQVRAAAPTFTRDVAGGLAAPTDPGISATSEQGAVASPVGAPAESEDEGEGQGEILESEEHEDESEDLLEESELTRQIDQVDAELAEAEAELNGRRAEIEKIRLRRDRMIEAREQERSPTQDQLERMRFIRRQAALRAERAGENALASKLAMEARGLGAASQLDRTLASRGGRPAPRPLKNIKE